MAFKLTYSDGQETDYDDGTVWQVDAGVLKMGRKEGEWSVLVSPSHWAVIEVGGAKSPDSDESDEDAEASDNESDEGADDKDKDDD